jgi:hypothetical protein
VVMSIRDWQPGRFSPEASKMVAEKQYVGKEDRDAECWRSCCTAASRWLRKFPGAVNWPGSSDPAHVELLRQFMRSEPCLVRLTRDGTDQKRIPKLLDGAAEVIEAKRDGVLAYMEENESRLNGTARLLFRLVCLMASCDPELAARFELQGICGPEVVLSHSLAMVMINHLARETLVRDKHAISRARDRIRSTGLLDIQDGLPNTKRSTVYTIPLPDITRPPLVVCPRGFTTSGGLVFEDMTVMRSHIKLRRYERQAAIAEYLDRLDPPPDGSKEAEPDQPVSRSAPALSSPHPTIQSVPGTDEVLARLDAALASAPPPRRKARRRRRVVQLPVAEMVARALPDARYKPPSGGWEKLLL